MIRRELILVFLCMTQLGVAFLCLSCTGVDNVSSANRNSIAMKSEYQATPSPTAPGTIRDVDFKNFTYPWYPSYLKSPYGSRRVALKDGKFEVEQNQKAGIWYLLLELDDVSYADLTGDAREEAIVYLRGISVINRFVGCVFIYALEDGEPPKLLWHYETGDRADGGLRKMEVENGALLIEQNLLEGAGGLCCPKRFVRRYFT